MSDEMNQKEKQNGELLAQIEELKTNCDGARAQIAALESVKVHTNCF